MVLILLFREIGEAFKALSDDKDCRVVVLSGAGRSFTAGGCSLILQLT